MDTNISSRFNIEKKMCDIKPPKKSGTFNGVDNISKSTQKYIGFGENVGKKLSIEFARDKSFCRDVPIEISQSVFRNKSENNNIEKKFIPKVVYYKVNPGKEINNKKSNFKNIFISVFILFLVLIFAFFFFLNKGMTAKDTIIENSTSAYDNIIKAQTYLKDLNFKQAGFEFAEAHRKFEKAQKEASGVGVKALNAFSWVPFLSQINSGVNLINVGVELSSAGTILSEAVEPLFKISSDSIFLKKDEIVTKDNYGGVLVSVVSGIENSKISFKNAEKSLNNVNPYDFPLEFQSGINELKNKFPEIKDKINNLSEYSDFATWLLGYDNPKNFLIISQNTSEIRATGGFVGSYGLLKSEFGYVRDISMDDIYNLDGQLSYKVVPPRPIQKISTAWSTHDANWFLDFPTSAEKVAFFYEKAGGPTPDGVIAINEKVIEDILRVVGSIEMKDYGVVLSADNFVEQVQHKVEKDYDILQNKPKKILDDMLPLLFERFSTLSYDQLMRLFNVFISNLDKKDIIIWANQPKYQDFVLEKGWAGEVMDAKGADYLAIVNTNINGYKTDRVINQKISKITKIEEDGSIVNTVKIKRVHVGGDKEYEWLNKVNADFMRVYVPFGSELLDATGYTLEDYEAPIDYKKAGFNFDKDILESENSLMVDKKTGTQIFKESGKTVFGNWVFVSPKEEVEVSYTYRLPFKLNKLKKSDNIDTVFQVQPGSDSVLDFKTELPKDWDFIYSKPERSFGRYYGEFNSDKFFSVGVKY
jgi:hypothetical protein